MSVTLSIFPVILFNEFFGFFLAVTILGKSMKSGGEMVRVKRGETHRVASVITFIAVNGARNYLC